MKKGYTRKVNLILGIAFLTGPIILASFIFMPAILTHLRLLAGVLFVAQVLFIIGCCFYAQGKGHHPALGLLGLLYIPGLIILALFPDKHRGEDPNSGCLSTLLFLLLFLALIFGPLFFYISTSIMRPSNGLRPTGTQSKMTDSIIKFNTTALESNHLDLATKLKALDSLFQQGQAGFDRVKEAHQKLKAKPDLTADERVLLTHMEVGMAAGPKRSDWELRQEAIADKRAQLAQGAMELNSIILYSPASKLDARMKAFSSLVDQGEAGLPFMKKALEEMDRNARHTEDDSAMSKRIRDYLATQKPVEISSGPAQIPVATSTPVTKKVINKPVPKKKVNNVRKRKKKAT